MPIPVSCGGCGRSFRAPDSAAGKKGRCPSCAAIVPIPAAELSPEIVEDDYQLAATPPEASVRSPAIEKAEEALRTASHAQMPAKRDLPGVTIADKPAMPGWVPTTVSATPAWLRHLHWCLALAMIPLAFSVLLPHETQADLIERFRVSLANAPQVGNPNESSEISMEHLFLLMPGHKLQGAFLARDTWLHWGFALVSVALYMTFFCFLATDKSANPLHLLGLGLFTATGGIVLLLVLQTIATALPLGSIRIRGGIIGLIFLLIGLIGLSYSMASDPSYGLLLSFVGYTAGVGLCEEICKALPLLVYYRNSNGQSWRGEFLWGLASGAGFGVSEGIMYSQSYYNGMSGVGIYVVRFVSCVALHAVWSGSVGISIHQNQNLLQEDNGEFNIFEYLFAAARLVLIPMVLHGLYDTLLKKDMDLAALATAGASFGFLAWQINHLRHSDDEDSRANFVAGYIRQRAATR